MKYKNQKGFTLIELLIVIAIIAVLSVVVILSLNPAELLRQARDSNRISDMATMKSAVSLYLVDVASPSLGTSTWCDMSQPSTTFYVPSAAGSWTSSTTCNSWIVGNVTSTSIVATSSRGITGYPTGWLPVNFSGISSGSPIGQEPIDPVNNAGAAACTGSSPSLSSCALFYSYAASSTLFKLAAFMESLKFYNGGSGAVTANDGGNNNYVYEGGSSPTL
jgi:prepilin-type N-terminal cleavage/methylation domain-containing protein